MTDPNLDQKPKTKQEIFKDALERIGKFKLIGRVNPLTLSDEAVIANHAIEQADAVKDPEIPKGPQIDPDKIPSIRTVEKSLGYGG